jgi:heme exporter protein B
MKGMLWKEWTLELRKKHALFGVVVYVLAAVYVCYLSLEEVVEIELWAALFWISALFASFNAMQRAFLAETGGQALYLYTLASPRSIVLSKSVYNALQLAFLNVLSLVFFVLFFGTGALAEADWMQLLLGLAIGGFGLGLALTFISALAFKTDGNSGLLAVLGFPVLVPLLITLVKYTQLALQGAPFSANGYHLLVLVVLCVMSAVLSMVLFPYLWRD